MVCSLPFHQIPPFCFFSLVLSLLDNFILGFSKLKPELGTDDTRKHGEGNRKSEAAKRKSQWRGLEQDPDLRGKGPADWSSFPDIALLLGFLLRDQLDVIIFRWFYPTIMFLASDFLFCSYNLLTSFCLLFIHYLICASSWYSDGCPRFCCSARSRTWKFKILEVHKQLNFCSHWLVYRPWVTVSPILTEH